MSHGWSYIRQTECCTCFERQYILPPPTPKGNPPPPVLRHQNFAVIFVMLTLSSSQDVCSAADISPGKSSEDPAPVCG